MYWNSRPAGIRIAIVTDAIHPFHTGGKERALFEIAKHLAADGYDVDVYTMRWWKGPSIIQRDGITFHALTRCRPLYTPAGRRSVSQAIFFAIATLKMVLRSYDHLYVDSIPFLPLICGRLVATLRRKPLLTIWYEFWGPTYWKAYLPGIASFVAAHVERFASRCPDSVMSISPHTTLRLEAEAAVRHLITIPLGVDLESIDAAAPSPERWDVLYAGRLLTHKNVDRLVHAIAQVRIDNPSVRCLIIGGGPELDHLVTLVTELRLEENVRFRPFLPDSLELYGLMKSARLFVLPSVREGFGLVVIEANACGTPVVTTNHAENAARDLVCHGSNGLLSSPDTTAIATGIRTILSGDADLLDEHELRRNAARFDWSCVAKTFEAELLPYSFSSAQSDAVSF